MRRLSAIFLASFLATTLSYCGGETRGVPIEFDAAIQGASISGERTRFTNAEGWDVEVTAAYVLVGPAWFYGGGARASRWPPKLGLPTALAHPADSSFDKGPILGELLVQYAVDLLADTPTSLGRLEGIEGQLATIELQLRAPGYGPLADAGDAATALGEDTFRVEGVATKDDVSVPFLAAGQLPEADNQQVVDSIDANVELTDRAGALVLEVNLDEWLGLVDFSRLTDTDPQGRYVFGEDQQPTAALQRGLRSRYAYSARWSTP